MITPAPKLKLIILWTLTLIGMILHFNYEVSGIFYGINLVRPNATGNEPPGLLVIRTLFYHLPFVWILLIMYTNNKWADLILFILSALYCMAHAFHFGGELFKEEKNLSQVSLLFIVFVTAVFLSVEHFNVYRRWNQSTEPA